MRATTLSQHFQHKFGAPPSLIALAPGRINLIGEHTDYNAGVALAASIDMQAMCALRQNPHLSCRILAADLGEDFTVHIEELVPQSQQWANYLVGVVKEFKKRGLGISGFDCVITSNVPVGIGLSSSAALCCSLAVGLNSLFACKLDLWSLANIAQAAENENVGANTGILDQVSSLFGQPSKALLIDFSALTVRPQLMLLPGHEFVLLNTGIKHNHLHSAYNKRREECRSALAFLQSSGWPGQNLGDLSQQDLRKFGVGLEEKARMRAEFVLAENARVRVAAQQLVQGDVVGFGESLTASHWGLSELYQVSCPESDEVVRFAEAHPGVKGARQIGGGFGGCVLALADSSAVDDFVDELQQHYFNLFGISLEQLSFSFGPGAHIRSHIQEVPQSELGKTVFDLDHSPHRRLNVLTGEWVLVSPQRNERPWQGQREASDLDSPPSYEPGCYLCPGNERAGAQVNPIYEDTFCFENDFPALSPTAGDGYFQEGLLVAEAEVGTCRVLCYSPDHAKTLAVMSLPEIEGVVYLWQSQFEELAAVPQYNYIQIFENKGQMMGCSNEHPHGQIWAQHTVPEIIIRKGQYQRAYYEDNEEQSLLSAYLEQEIAEEIRIIYVDAHFVALVPWWAVWPFEVLIAPRRPMQQLTELTPEEIGSFAATLSSVTSRFDRLFKAPFPYSSGLHQAPCDAMPHPYWHWHMEFKPPLLRSASIRKFMVGYELFAMPQRDLTPERAAEMLREV